jgi:hypothetical protein
LHSKGRIHIHNTSENRLLRTIFEPKGEEVTKGSTKLLFAHFTRYYYGDKNNQYEIGGTWHAVSVGEMRDMYTLFV